MLSRYCTKLSKKQTALFISLSSLYRFLACSNHLAVAGFVDFFSLSAFPFFAVFLDRVVAQAAVWADSLFVQRVGQRESVPWVLVPSAKAASSVPVPVIVSGRVVGVVELLVVPGQALVLFVVTFAVWVLEYLVLCSASVSLAVGVWGFFLLQLSSTALLSRMYLDRRKGLASFAFALRFLSRDSL